MSDGVEIRSQKLLAHEWGKLTQYVVGYRRRDGVSQELTREVYDRGDAAVILLLDPARRTVVLTRQFRLPVWLAGHDGGMLIEACAGLLEGSSPEDRIRAEAEEETGYRVGTVTHLFDAWMSPGSVSEKLSFFLGHYDASSRISDGGGLAHEGEDIEVLELPLADAIALARTGEISDAKTIMLLQHAALEGY